MAIHVAKRLYQFERNIKGNGLDQDSIIKLLTD